MKESIQFSYPAIKKFLIRLPCWKWTQEGQGKDRVACTSLDPHINTSVHNTLTWMHGHSSHQKTEQRSTDHNTHCQSVTSFSVQDAITPGSSQNYYLGPNPFPSLTPTPRFVPQNRVGVVVEISAVYVTTGIACLSVSILVISHSHLPLIWLGKSWAHLVTMSRNQLSQWLKKNAATLQAAYISFALKACISNLDWTLS